MRYTANYNLKKPEETDVIDIVDLNDNSDIVDAGLKKLENTIESLNADGITLPDGKTISEKFTEITKEIGNTEELNTETKLSLVSAINEINQALITHKADYTTFKQDANTQLKNTKGTISAAFNIGDVTTKHACQANASVHAVLDALNTQINVSQYVKNDTAGTTAWGWGVLEPSTQNIKVEISSREGTVKSSGAITGNSSFADFAEYFESEDGNAIPLGTIISLAENGKIRPAQEDDYMVGIISQTAGVILNAQGFEWKDRYLYDRYGQPILVEKEIEDEFKLHKMYEEYLKTNDYMELEEYKNTLADIPMTTIKVPVLNKNWNEDKEYIPREDRPEWNVVGLTGQIYTNIDETVQEGDFIKVGKNGIATKGRNEYGQNWQVMKITTPYEESLGFGIAIVFVR